MKMLFKVTLIVLVALTLVLGVQTLNAQDEVKKEDAPKTGCKMLAHGCAAAAAGCKAGDKCVHKTLYVCPDENCKYQATEPGKCKCGKELVKKVFCNMTCYVCPMEKCEYKSDKPGKCKCGQELVKKEIMHEVKTVYVCPEKDCPYKAEAPGKCPKCGKELVMKEICCGMTATAGAGCKMAEKPCPHAGQEKKDK